MDVDDASVIEAARTTPEAFGELFERHFDRVHRFCARRVGSARAEDLAGETFRRAFEARCSYDLERPSALPWLFGIAMNLVRSELRAGVTQDQALARFAVLAQVTVPDPAGDVVSLLDAKVRLATVARLLSSLPRDDVEALLLHVWDELSYADVATVLNVPVGTVRSRLSRLRRRLDALTSQGTQHPDELRTGIGGQ